MITEPVVVLPVTRFFPITLPAVQAAPLLTPVTTRLSSNLGDAFDVSVLTVFPSDSDVDFLKHGIIKMPTSKANGSYTILLVGETGVGKSPLLKMIANVLLGNDIDHYDLDILNRPPKEQGAVGQTVSPHLYEITSVGGILVSSRVFNSVSRLDLFLSFVSSTHLDWPALAVLSKTKSTRKIL